MIVLRKEGCTDFKYFKIQNYTNQACLYPHELTPTPLCSANYSLYASFDY